MTFEYVELKTKEKLLSSEREHDVEIVFYAKNSRVLKQIPFPDLNEKTCYITTENYGRTREKIVRISFRCETIEVIPELCNHVIKQIGENTDIYLKRVRIEMSPEIDIVFPSAFFEIFVYKSDLSYTKILFEENDLEKIPFNYQKLMNHRIEIGKKRLYGTDWNTQNKLLFTLYLDSKERFLTGHVILNREMSLYNEAKKLQLKRQLENAGIQQLKNAGFRNLYCLDMIKYVKIDE